MVRYVQPPDVGIHADFQHRFDKDMRREKQVLLAEKAQLNPPSSKICANEWREMVVKVGCSIYYDQLTEAAVQRSWARAGFSDDPARTDIVLSSGTKVFPSAFQPSFVQEGHGLKILGIGTERTEPQDKAPPQMPSSRPALNTVHHPGDRMLRFSTEREKATQRRKSKCRKVEAATTDEEEEEEHESTSESSEEEERPFDRDDFLAEAKSCLNWILRSFSTASETA